MHFTTIIIYKTAHKGIVKGFLQIASLHAKNNIICQHVLKEFPFSGFFLIHLHIYNHLNIFLCGCATILMCLFDKKKKLG